MLRIKTCASTSNLGPGFDCLGLALNIYNYFDVEINEKDELINVEDRYNTPDNLFLTSYHKACTTFGVDDHIRVRFNCDIPVSRGLGSSSSLITGAIKAASVLHGNCLSDEEIFQMVSKIEGHPDNAAPCVYGGFNASFVDSNNAFHNIRMNFSDEFRLAVFIPNFEVSTAKARSILPDSYSRQIAVNNASKAILTVHALENGDLDLLKEVARDEIHEPYRKKLIHEFDELQKIYQEDTDGVLLISGSGSTCFGIARKELSASGINKLSDLKHNWNYRPVSISHKGAELI